MGTGQEIDSEPGVSPRPRRLGQLTYASYQEAAGPAGDQPGGWQVKQQTAGLTAAERRLVDAVLVTDLRSPAPLSRFPTQAEIDQRPRKLRFDRVEDIAVYCASVNAGLDASGRPDNVFNHVLVDADPSASLDAEPPLRPIELWGSPRWLSPFGAAEVLEARFDPDDPPSRAGVLTRQAVVDFLFDEASYRFGALAFLLDAVSSALRGGRRVLLAAPSSTEGALWIAAVSFLTAPLTCLRLSFSTYSRLAELTSSAPILSVVAAEDIRDLTAGPSAGAVVVDPVDEPDLRATEAGETWVNRFGEPVAVSDWSRLALDVCSHGADMLSALLRDADEISRLCDWAAPDDEPGWALAVAVAQHEELQASWPPAARLVMGGPPLTVLSSSLPENVLAAMRRLIVGRDVRTAADAWELVGDGRAARSADLFLLAYGMYLEFALADPDWLCGVQPAPVPEMPRWPSAADTVRTAVTTALQSHPDRTPQGAPEGPALSARILDLCVRAFRSVDVPAAEMLTLDGPAESVAAGLLTSDASRIVAEAGPISPDSARFIGAALAHLSGAAPLRLGTAVVDWLSPGYTDLIGTGPADLLRMDPVSREILVQLCAHDPEFARRHRVVGVLAVLMFPAPEVPVPVPGGTAGAAGLRGVLRRIGGPQEWSEPELRDLLTWAPEPWIGELADVVTEALYRRPITGGGHHLARTVLSRVRTSSPATELLDVYVLLDEDWYLRSDGFPLRAPVIIDAALKCWPRTASGHRRVIAPHIVVAAFQIHAALHGSGGCAEAVRLRDEAIQFQDLDIPPEIVEDGLHMAASMLKQALTRSGDLMDLAVGACADLTRAGRWHSFLLMRLPDQLARTMAAPTLAGAVLKSYWADYDRREGVKYGKYIADLTFDDPSSGDAFWRWWATVIPPARGIDKLGGVRSAFLRKKGSDVTTDRAEQGETP